MKRLDQRIQRLVRADPQAQMLQTWPGIGPFGAALLLAEIGSIARFRTSHELAAYAGLTPSTQSSGGKTTHVGVGRSGSPWLGWGKVIGLLRKLRHRGRDRVAWIFTFTNAAYNLVRMRTLIEQGVST